MTMKFVSIVSLGALVVGCSDSPEDCTDTYRSGLNGDTYETTCAEPVRRGPVPQELAEVELAAGDCVESYETVCPPGEECHELYERRCEDATANVSSTEIGQLEQALLLPDCQIDNNEHTVAALRPVFDPFLTALRAVNINFAEDDDEVDSNFFMRQIQSRGQQGSLDVRSMGVLDFDADGQDVMGRTRCIRDGATGDRGRCEVVVFRDAVALLSEETGLDPFEVEFVTVMHEFGHTFCLDHDNVDSSARITAMNSHHLRDTSRPQLDYLRFLGGERDQVRSILRNP